MDNVISVLPFLEVSRERQQDIYHLGGETCFLYVKTQKSCHATYHQPVMAATTAHKDCRSRTLIQDYPQQLQQEVGSCVNKNPGTTQRIHVSTKTFYYFNSISS